MLMTLGVSHDLQAQVFVTRDYLSGITLAQGQLEVSADYLVMNETVDLLNLRESRIAKTSTALRSDGLGDLKGAQVMAAYGLRDNMMISGSYHYRQLNVTFADLDVDGYALHLSRRYNLYQRPDASAAYLFGVIGGRHHRSADFSTERISDINYLAGKLSSRFTVRDEYGRLVIDDGEMTYSSPRVNADGTIKDPLALGLRDSSDTTLFVRGGAGRRWERINIALLAEAGYTVIRGQLSHNLHLYGIDSDNRLLREIDFDLDREETYIKAGVDLYYETLFGVAAHLAYYYLVLQRDSSIDRHRDNHHLSAELILRLNRYAAVTIGGEYYRNQFNGIVPLLYNRYTQSAFDRDYGIVKAGLTVVFGRPGSRL